MPSVRGGDLVYQTEEWFLLPLLQSFLTESHRPKEQGQALQSKPGEGEGGGGGPPAGHQTQPRQLSIPGSVEIAEETFDPPCSR